MTYTPFIIVFAKKSQDNSFRIFRAENNYRYQENRILERTWNLDKCITSTLTEPEIMTAELARRNDMGKGRHRIWKSEWRDSVQNTKFIKITGENMIANYYRKQTSELKFVSEPWHLWNLIGRGVRCS